MHRSNVWENPMNPFASLHLIKTFFADRKALDERALSDVTGYE